MYVLDVLSGYDKLERKDFTTGHIVDALLQLFPQDKSLADELLKQEYCAFYLVENYPDTDFGWGCYYGPSSNYDQTLINFITNEVIDYWENRAYQVINPILKARYSGLVCEFTKIKKGKEADYRIRTCYVQSLIYLIKNEYVQYDSSKMDYIKRAVEFSIRLNHKELIKLSKESCIDFAKSSYTDLDIRKWNFCFEVLIKNRKKIRLSDTEEQNIIGAIEESLVKRTSINNQIPDVCKSIELLVAYYKKANLADNVYRILSLFERLAKNEICNSPHLTPLLLEKTLHFYKNYGAKTDIDRILIDIREQEPIKAASLSKITFNFETRYTYEEIKEKIEVLENDVFFTYVIKDFIYEIETIDYILSKTYNDSPLYFIIPQSIQDKYGRTIDSVGPIDKDREKHLILFYNKALSFFSLDLNLTIQVAINIKKFNIQSVIDFIKQSPIIKPNRYPIIEESLAAYFDHKYIVATHLLIPQIEQGFRTLLELSKGNVYKEDNGSYSLRTFDDILRDPILEKVIGVSDAFYFRVLFTHKLGWNLRNELCHGFMDVEDFNRMRADRVFHALLYLGSFRSTDNSQE